MKIATMIDVKMLMAVMMTTLIMVGKMMIKMMIGDYYQ